MFPPNRIHRICHYHYNISAMSRCNMQSRRSHQAHNALRLWHQVLQGGSQHNDEEDDDDHNDQGFKFEMKHNYIWHH